MNEITLEAIENYINKCIDEGKTFDLDKGIFVEKD